MLAGRVQASTGRQNERVNPQRRGSVFLLIRGCCQPLVHGIRLAPRFDQANHSGKILKKITAFAL